MDISLPTRNNGPILLSDVKKWKGLFKHEFLNKQGSKTFYLIDFYPDCDRKDLIQTLTEDQYSELFDKTQYQEIGLFKTLLTIESKWNNDDFNLFDETTWLKMTRPYL